MLYLSDIVENKIVCDFNLLLSMLESFLSLVVVFEFLVHVDHDCHDVDFWKVEKRVVDEKSTAVILQKKVTIMNISIQLLIGRFLYLILPC